MAVKTKKKTAKKKPKAVKKKSVKKQKEQGKPEPKKPEKPLVIPVLDLYDALRGVKDGASKDDLRRHIACVHIAAKSSRKTPKGEDGQLDLVATNGHVIYVWRQRLKGASDRAFSLPNRAVTRLLRELTDIRREYLEAEKKWNNAGKYAKNPRKPKPEEPTITFSNRFYRHELGEMRLDTLNEKFPSYETLVSGFELRTTAPPAAGINSAYLAQVCKNIQRVTGNKNIGIRMEFDKRATGGLDLPMMRFTVPGKDATCQLTCLVMPMRI